MCYFGEQRGHQICTVQLGSHRVECHLFTASRMSHLNWLLQRIHGNPFPQVPQVRSLRSVLFPIPTSATAPFLFCVLRPGQSLKWSHQPGLTSKTVTPRKITFRRCSLVFSIQFRSGQEAASRRLNLEEKLITQGEAPGSRSSALSRMKTGTKI